MPRPRVARVSSVTDWRSMGWKLRAERVTRLQCYKVTRDEAGYFTSRMKQLHPVAADVRRRTRFADGTIRLLTSAATALVKYPGEAGATGNSVDVSCDDETSSPSTIATL